MKPELPPEIVKQLPEDVVRHIMSFVPHLKKTPTPKPSPSLQSALKSLGSYDGCDGMYLRDLDDFMLDDKPIKKQQKRK